MKVFVAGASGVVGIPVVRQLLKRGHTVVGMASSPAGRATIESLGASAVVADAYDRDGLSRAVRAAAPDAVINMLSKFRGTPMRLSQVQPANRMRIEGTRNLLDAAISAGVRRFVCESMVFIYGYGQHEKPVTESEPPGRESSPGRQRIVDAMVSSERQVREATARGEIEGVSLRFGLFHGPLAPSMWDMVELVRKRRLPIVGDGLHSYIDVSDAAHAVCDALERAAPGSVYNVVDDQPVAFSEYLGELARLVDAPPPRHVPVWVVKPFASFVAAFVPARLPVSNAKIKAELGWRPRFRTYREALAPIGAGARSWSEPAAGRDAPEVRT